MTRINPLGDERDISACLIREQKDMTVFQVRWKSQSFFSINAPSEMRMIEKETETGLVVKETSVVVIYRREQERITAIPGNTGFSKATD